MSYKGATHRCLIRGATHTCLIRGATHRCLIRGATHRCLIRGLHIDETVLDFRKTNNFIVHLTLLKEIYNDFHRNNCCINIATQDVLIFITSRL